MRDLILDGWLLPVLVSPFVGSFLSVLVRRLPAGKGVVTGRSACPECGQRLAPADLVPLLSWLLSRGRCRHCGKPISALYPGIEGAAVVVAAWAALVVGGWLLWASCVLGWTLLALALIDLRHHELPDELTLPLVPAGLAVSYFVDPDRLANHVIGAAAGFAAFYLIARAYRLVRGREGLGLGDAKLLAGAGAWVSWPGLPSVVVVAGAVALAATLAQRARGRALTGTIEVPFGTYLALGVWLVWLHGPLATG